MYSVHQHWDPLKVCVVGRSYPPEFYSWITVPHVRRLFEQIATETEEDYQAIISKLQEFRVEILRPDLPNVTFKDGQHVPPPMTPRDYTVMIGNTFYTGYGSNNSEYGCFDKIFQHIRDQGNTVNEYCDPVINGAMVSRVGRDLYFGTPGYGTDVVQLQQFLDQEFTNTRNHIVDTRGHSDGTYCPVSPGLIVSIEEIKTYRDSFPDWEVVYVPPKDWAGVSEFLMLKNQNRGKWWIPGFEQDQDVANTVEQWLGHWTGYVEETVFDVNMLIIDPKNVIVFNYNQLVFDALERHGITPHVVPFRHRYFWDGGIHCVTSDLHREGTQQNYFTERD